MPNTFSKLSTGLFALNSIWHGLAAYYFTQKPRGILNKYSTVRPASEQGQDILRFLGALNIGYFLLAFLAFIRMLNSKKPENAVRATDLWVLGMANFSQFLYDLVVHRKEKVTRAFLQITIPDGLFGLLDFIFALWSMQIKSKK